MTKHFFYQSAGVSRWLSVMIIAGVLLLSVLFIWRFGLDSLNSQAISESSYLNSLNSDNWDIKEDQPRTVKPVQLPDCMVGKPCRFSLQAVDPEGDKLVYRFYNAEKKELLKPLPANSGAIIKPSLVFRNKGVQSILVVVADEAGHVAPELTLQTLVK